MVSQYLYSIHDRDSHPIIPPGGWCVDAVLVADTPPNYRAIRGDINWIVRLNHGWHPNGTIPASGQYDQFAKQCATYVSLAIGADWCIIGNEPNHRQEWPQGNAIDPEQYADCFNRCYAAIKSVRPDARVLVAAVAPWNIEIGYSWIDYYQRMLDWIDACDGFAIHGYTHGADPNLIFDTAKVNGWYWHFPVLYQTLGVIPNRFAGLPIHVTETDQGDNAWVDSNSGWVQNAYQSIDSWNRANFHAPILSLALYRWRGDKWQIYDKPQVQADFQAAVARGYASPPVQGLPQPTPPLPTDRAIDPDLIRRGVKFEFANPPAGMGYWRIKAASWLDEAEADAVGPDHHILGTVKREQVEAAGIAFYVGWPDGWTTVTSKADDPNASYNYNFPMTASLNEFMIEVNDGNPSDKAFGIGMGKDGNPGIHTSTWIDWEWAEASGDTPPQPQPPIASKLVHPLPGSTITQHFYQNPQNYTQFGLPGHNGTDFGGVPQGTLIACIAGGKVVYSAWDDSYGYYVRVQHDELGICSFYAHLSAQAMPVGRVLQAGDPVGLVGSTGNSTGAHLHLEIRAINPDGSYAQGVMAKGRLDPETWFVLHGLTL